MNKMINRFSRAQVLLWQYPCFSSDIFQLCSHKTNVASLQPGISVGDYPFQKHGFVQSTEDILSVSFILHLIWRTEKTSGTKQRQCHSLQCKQSAAERNTVFDRLLRVHRLEVVYVDPILGKHLRTHALHFKLMLLCNAGETKTLLSHSLVKLYISRQQFPWG